MSMKETAAACESASGMVGLPANMGEGAAIAGVYHVVLRGAREECQQEYLRLIGRLAVLKRLAESFLGKLPLVGGSLRALVDQWRTRADLMTEIKWQGEAPNLVTTVGKNFLLDNGLAGTSYTAALYLGLIGSGSYTGVNVADTMASHAGWLECGSANAPAYSETTRRTAAWNGAAGGSKAFSSGVTFTFTSSGTVKGCFLTTVATKDGATGTLYSAGLFSGGDQPVVASNTLTVTYTATLT